MKGLKCQIESVAESVSATAVCENFIQFITLVTMDTFNVDQCRAKMIFRGITFYKKVAGASGHISKLGKYVRISKYRYFYVVGNSVLIFVTRPVLFCF